MNKYYGGNQNKMRDSKIEKITYLGLYNHPHKLKVGEVQHMTYTATDIGPYHLSKEMKEELKHNKELEEDETKKYTCSELIDMLKNSTNSIDPPFLVVWVLDHPNHPQEMIQFPNS